MAKQSDPRAKERLHALYLLKSGLVEQEQTVAHLLVRGTATVRRWLGAYKRGGIEALLGRGTSTKVRWRFEYFWVYGAVEPARGESQFWLFTHMDGECFEAFMQALSRAYPEELLVVQVDNGGFHRKSSMQIPDNVFLVFQPPYSPEVNPIERVWQHLKDQLAWKGFETLGALEAKVSEELVKLEAGRVRSLTGYPFLMDTLSRSLL